MFFEIRKKTTNTYSGTLVLTALPIGLSLLVLRRISAIIASSKLMVHFSGILFEIGLLCILENTFRLINSVDH